ncbi:MAG: thiol-disulfide oxidoreductase ResA [Bacillaceae bacterium]|nr:thiol-disulfide oxidoreductase ResA [Bacillaceae bacterium]
MKKSKTGMRILILAILFIAVVGAIYNTAFTDKQAIKEGAKAPDFVLPELRGGTIQLSDLKGKGVVLNFWGSWCPPCVEEMPALNRAYHKYQDDGVEIIGINISESKVAVSSFVQRLNLDFPILLDQKREITNLYEIDPIPTTFFIDKDGIIQKIVIGGPMSDQTIQRYITQIMPE